MGSDGDEVERAQGGNGPPRVGIRHQNVDTAGIESPHGMRLACQHGLDHGRVVARGLPTTRASPEGEAVSANSARFDIGGQSMLRSMEQFEIAGETFGCALAQIATGPVDVSRDGRKRMKGAKCLHAVTSRIDPVA